MKRVACILLLLLLSGSVVWSKEKKSSPPIDKAMQVVRNPAGGFGNMSPSGLQVHYRLVNLLDRVGYKYDASHAAAWKGLMLDEKENMYARLCAAYFLLDERKDARDFMTQQVRSKNLRYRYNACEALRLYVDGNPKKSWGIDLLIQLLADGSLDGSGVTESPPEEYPDGDRDDIMETPLEPICWGFGYMKEKKAVDALISVLRRLPATGGAASALGEIGDARAIPILLKVLKENSGPEDCDEVRALGQLKCKEAVPILISRLGHPKTPFSGLDTVDTEVILEALLAIGDQRAVRPIEDYLRGDYPKKSKAVAKRVLVQLQSKDPVDALLTLLRNETYEPERSEIIAALVKYKGKRLVKELSTIARTSNSAFMRREAILGLRDIGNRQSLLVLASLLDLTFPKDLKAEWGWKGEPDFQKYFPETIALCLRECTKQDFGANRVKWEEWITKNVKDENPPDEK